MVWAPSLSLAATQKIVLTFFSSGYLDVSVHRVPPYALSIHAYVHALPACEFPHSDICASQLARSSTQLFAACHVLLRRLVPRHPPYALCSLIFSFFLSFSQHCSLSVKNTSFPASISDRLFCLPPSPRFSLYPSSSVFSCQ